LATTRYSDQTGQATFPEDVHLLQQYWGMPRRIRLDMVEDELCCCSLCGVQTQQSVKSFRTKNYGANYDGPWIHPLTPYRFDPQKKNIPLSLKGQQGGLGYRHWLGLVWQDDDNGDQAAYIVRTFNEERIDLIGAAGHARLWCFGYDMDNMKARCWYEHTLPLLRISGRKKEMFLVSVAKLLVAAKDAVFLLRGQVKAAWFKRPADAKGDMSLVVSEFWQQTETDFYRQLNALSQLPDEFRQTPSDVARQWLATIKNTTMSLFDQWTMAGNAEDMNMRRIVKARQELEKKLDNAKPFKELRQIALAEKEVQV
jgi:CRISPR system Cascade subunit CasA